MNRDPRIALSQELEAKQTRLEQLRVLAADDPDFFTDIIEGETNLLELISALDASILDDEILADGAKAALDKHYAHLAPSYLAEQIRKFAPVLGTNVVGMRR